MTDHANCVPMDQHNDWLRRLREVEADREILLRDVTTLRASLADVEAERDIARDHSLDRLAANIDLRARAETVEDRLADVVRELTPFADGCMGTGEYKLCHDMSEAVENALAAAAGDDR